MLRPLVKEPGILTLKEIPLKEPYSSLTPYRSPLKEPYSNFTPYRSPLKEPYSNCFSQAPILAWKCRRRCAEIHGALEASWCRVSGLEFKVFEV